MIKRCKSYSAMTTVSVGFFFGIFLHMLACLFSATLGSTLFLKNLIAHFQDSIKYRLLEAELTLG